MEPLWHQCKEILEPEQEISRKKSILIHLISLLEWAKVRHLYIYLLINLITVISQQKDSSILHRIILILALGKSLNLHIFEFSHFRPDLIAPINFGSLGRLGIVRSSLGLVHGPHVSAALGCCRYYILDLCVRYSFGCVHLSIYPYPF